MVHSTRTTILILVLLASIGGYFAYEKINTNEYRVRSVIKPLDIENKIYAVTVKEKKNNRVTFEVDFQYNGKSRYAYIKIEAETYPTREHLTYGQQVLRSTGRQQKNINIWIPGGVRDEFVFINPKITMVGDGKNLLAEKSLNEKIVMNYDPDYHSPYDKNKSVDENFKKAVRLIDEWGGNRAILNQAKTILDKVLSANPDNPQVYIELARYNMGANWSEAGLKSAETILQQSLGIDDKYANTHVLLGYVYTHQGRYDDAIREFEIAEKLGTDNLWLYTNWAQSYAKQNDVDAANRVYEKVIGNEKTYTRNDRALLEGVRQYRNFAISNNDYARLGRILKRRSELFPGYGCFYMQNADYYVTHERDLGAAAREIEKADEAGCGDQELVNKVKAKNLLVKSLYHDYPSTELAEQDYRRSRAIYQNEARLISDLSNTKSVDGLYKRLKSKWGVGIDDVGTEGASPLAYCVAERKYICVENLLANGANPNQIANDREWSLLMIAVLSRDKAMVQRLLLAGSDPDHKSKDGVTASDMATMVGDADMVSILKGASKI